MSDPTDDDELTDAERAALDAPMSTIQEAMVTHLQGQPFDEDAVGIAARTLMADQFVKVGVGIERAMEIVMRPGTLHLGYDSDDDMINVSMDFGEAADADGELPDVLAVSFSRSDLVEGEGR